MKPRLSMFAGVLLAAFVLPSFVTANTDVRVTEWVSDHEVCRYNLPKLFAAKFNGTEEELREYLREICPEFGHLAEVPDMGADIGRARADPFDGKE